jgi:hypothetical protein
MFEQERIGESTTIVRLRAVTGEIHAGLERRLDAIERFSQPASRSELIARLAALHAPAAFALAHNLRDISGLELTAVASFSICFCWCHLVSRQPGAFDRLLHQSCGLGLLDKFGDVGEPPGLTLRYHHPDEVGSVMVLQHP